MKFAYWAIIVICMFSLILAEKHASEQSLTVITPDNVNQVEEIARIGDGILTSPNWSPNGDLIAVAGSLGVWLYDAIDITRQPRLLDGHTERVINAIFDPTGKYIASIGLDNQIIIWDVATEKILHQFVGRSTLTFNQDGTIIAYQDVSDKSDVIVYSLLENKRIATLPADNFIPLGLSLLRFSPDEQKIVGVFHSYRWGYMNHVQVWDIKSESILIQTEEGAITAEFAEISKGGNRLLIIDARGKIHSWDIVSGELLHTVLGTPPYKKDEQRVLHTLNRDTDHNIEYARAYSFSPDQQKFAYVRGHLEIWDIDVGLLQRSEGEFISSIREIKIDEANRIMAVLKRHQIDLWNLDDPYNPSIVTQIPIESILPHDIELTETGGLLLHNRFMVSYIENPVENSDVKWTHSLDNGHTSAITAMQDKVLIAELDSEQGKYWFEELQLDTGTSLGRTMSKPFLNGYDRLDSELLDVKVNSQAGLIATGSSVVRLWDLETKQEVATLFDFTEPESFWASNELLFVSDGDYLLAGSRKFGPGFIIWDTANAIATYDQVKANISTDTGSRLLDFSHGYESPTAYRFANDQLVVTGVNPDLAARIQNTDNWAEVHSLKGHHASIYDVAVLNDQVIITAGNDGTIRFWGIPVDS